MNNFEEFEETWNFLEDKTIRPIHLSIDGTIDDLEKIESIIKYKEKMDLVARKI